MEFIWGIILNFKIIAVNRSANLAFLEFLNLYFYREIAGVKILLTPALEFYLTKIR